jgi:hypothetical protein
MKVKPVQGRIVRDPRTMAILPQEGREVPDSDAYWQRRIRDGDVTAEPTSHSLARDEKKGT